MNYQAAVEELSFQCGSHPEINDPLWAAGFHQRLCPNVRELAIVAMDHAVLSMNAVAANVETAPKPALAVVNSLSGIRTSARTGVMVPTACCNAMF